MAAKAWTCEGCGRKVGRHTYQCLCGTWAPEITAWTCKCGQINSAHVGRCMTCRTLRPPREIALADPPLAPVPAMRADDL